MFICAVDHSIVGMDFAGLAGTARSTFWPSLAVQGAFPRVAQVNSNRSDTTRAECFQQLPKSNSGLGFLIETAMARKTPTRLQSNKPHSDKTLHSTIDRKIPILRPRNTSHDL
jgi:hypothetical protein